MKKTALIFGVLGQDGSFMAELLHSKGYNVIGITKPYKPKEMYRMDWIRSLVPDIKIMGIDLFKKNTLDNLMNSVKPDEVYNFAAISNVWNPMENIDQVFELNARLPQMIMSSIYQFSKQIKYFQASSCLIFGRDISGLQDENTPYNPMHAYGAAKLYADNMVREFRHNGTFFCSGIFFPHESERRGDQFFSKKVTKAVSDIRRGKLKKVQLGDLSTHRDFGYAKEYVHAAYLMMQSNEPKDYVIGTGNVISMLDFTRKCFDYVGLNYKDYVEIDSDLIRSKENLLLRANPDKIYKELGWKAEKSVDDIISLMINYELDK